MPEVSESRALLATEIAIGLHDLCQPLTALQCRLEIGMMDSTPAGMETAIVDSLAECARLNTMLREMQDKVHRSARHESAGGL